MAGKQLQDKVWVAIHQKTAIVRVEGRGSFKISTALKEFGNAAIASGCRSLVLDMSQCVGMDSTFMGVLAGLAGRLKQRHAGEMVLLNLSPRTLNLVVTLGLDQIVRACPAGETPEEYKSVAAMTQMLSALQPGEGESRRDTRETMLEAHENLVKLSPENAPRFKDVLAYLREDLNKKASADQESS